MNGPEHYAEAERLITSAVVDFSPEAPYHAVMLARAQVHATLALAAATLVSSESGYTAHRILQWGPALGPEREPGTRAADMGPL